MRRLSAYAMVLILAGCASVPSEQNCNAFVAAAPAADASAWGPFSSLIGRTWVTENSSNTGIHTYEWTAERRAIKWTMISPYAGGNLPVYLRPGTNSDQWDACVEYTPGTGHTVYRLAESSTILSDWQTAGSANVRWEIRVPPEGGYEARAAFGSGASKPDFPPNYLRFRAYSSDELVALGPRLAQESTAFEGDVARLIAETRERERQEKARKEAEKAQLWNNVGTALGTVAQAAADVSAEYARNQERIAAENDARRRVLQAPRSHEPSPVANNVETESVLQTSRAPSATRMDRPVPVTATSKSSAASASDAGRASTDTDANRCVSQSAVRENDTFKGNTAAYVVNGCGTPVDVRVCLMTESGWKCGATLGLAPQASWSYSAFHATGGVFVDARTTGSDRRFASPD